MCSPKRERLPRVQYQHMFVWNLSSCNLCVHRACHSYLRHVNVVNGEDNLFIGCVCVCICARILNADSSKAVKTTDFRVGVFWPITLSLPIFSTWCVYQIKLCTCILEPALLKFAGQKDLARNDYDAEDFAGQIKTSSRSAAAGDVGCNQWSVDRSDQMRLDRLQMLCSVHKWLRR